MELNRDGFVEVWLGVTEWGTKPSHHDAECKATHGYENDILHLRSADCGKVRGCRRYALTCTVVWNHCISSNCSSLSAGHDLSDEVRDNWKLTMMMTDTNKCLFPDNCKRRLLRAKSVFEIILSHGTDVATMLNLSLTIWAKEGYLYWFIFHILKDPPILEWVHLLNIFGYLL